MASKEVAIDLLVRSREREWVVDIIHNLEEEDEDDREQQSVCIFTIPTTLFSTNKEAYTPQQVAIGPYHHRRPDLYEMERYKLSSARRMQKKLSSGRLRDVVKRFMELECSIRACYHKYLDLDCESLAWRLAIDASFLLELLQTFGTKNGNTSTEVSIKSSHIVDYTGRKSAYQAILRDIVMLENQIPFFLLRELLAFYNYERPNEVLAKMVKGYLKTLSPIKAPDDFPSCEEDILERIHLLELMYYVLVYGSGGKASLAVEIEAQETFQRSRGCCGKVLHSVSYLLSFLNTAPVRYLRRILTSKQVLLLLKLPWEIIKRIRHVTSTNPVDKFATSAEEVATEVDIEEFLAKTPLVEELSIPSVSELFDVGIRFRPAKGGISTIKFDKASATIYLPTINLDEHSDVLLRNLVAFEASIAPEIMGFTRYVDLMNGIIDTKEDVKILRESGIIFNRLKSDSEVSSLWNGMSRTVKTSKVPKLDKAIKNINRYYSSTWSVRAGRAMKKYVFGSWPVLTFLAANILLLLTALEAFCSMYKCSGWTPSR